mmetsp:Transcript_64125/g.119242  ORF Transcript_64125/g.119242 Transcript_64125/m.119242 type:complete len:85 (+) Transcript_64125:769-1023(+)
MDEQARLRLRIKQQRLCSIQSCLRCLASGEFVPDSPLGRVGFGWSLRRMVAAAAAEEGCDRFVLSADMMRHSAQCDMSIMTVQQ